MCAINGFNFKDNNLIAKMNQATRHRGPDGSGVFSDSDISLGHNRLSIIDLSLAASQPMHSVDGNLIIVFNGEIYNFRALKRELTEYRFKTESDTEVILAAYKKWGYSCVKKFNGIFAFAIWDKNKKELFLARDPIGVKPFYYFWDPSTSSGRAKFIFSSEIKAILEHNIPRVLDLEAFNHYLRVLYVPEPLTMLEGIRKFPPASYAALKENNLVIKKYWEFGDKKYFSGSGPELKKMLRERVENSVQSQLISDRPLGIYLSGGIDSSIVLDCVSRVRKNIDTFSVGFELTDEEQREKFNEDFNLARRTAKYYGTNHNEVLLSEQDVLDNFEKAVYQLDEPISNPTILSMFKLASFAKKKADVVLGGDGGDELFGGYDRYRFSLMASYYQKLPSFFRKLLSGKEKFKKLNTPEGIERFALFMFQKDEILKRVAVGGFLDEDISKKFFEEKFFSPSRKNKKFEELFMDTDRQSWLVDESLMMTDKMSMSSGLEARVPLLDRDLTEFARRIPLKYKVNIFNAKIILKEAFRGRIPNFLYNQSKRGWFSPAAKWLRRPKIYEMAQEILSENYYGNTEPLFEWAKLRKVLKNHYEKKEYNLNILWSLLTFQVWARLFRIQLVEHA